MTYVVISTVALLASGLTFFSGFGLGTLLMPAFAFFFPVEQAVALTAVVHFLNGVFKLALVGKHADRGIVARFGLPAIMGSLLGAWALVHLARIGPAFTYSAFEKEMAVQPAKLVVGLCLLFFAAMEVVPRLQRVSFGSGVMPIGGLLSGFFGGLSGMQGALRSAFLSRAGLTKEAFIGTGAAIACLIDVSRLGVYGNMWRTEGVRFEYGLLIAAVLAAFAGAMLGNRWLKKTTMEGVQKLVAVLLVVVAAGLISGVL